MTPRINRALGITIGRDETVVIAGVPRGGTTWLAELFAHLPRAIKNLKTPSRVTKEGSPILAGSGDQPAGWRKHLDAGEVSRILGILERFGLGGLYTDSLEPNYDAIYVNEPRDGRHA